MLSVEKIERLICPILKKHEITKHHISLIQQDQKILQICIACNDKKVDLDLCEAVSQDISIILDEADTIDESYTLDVCSFGAEKVLEDKQEIMDHINNYIHIDLHNPINNLVSIEGNLDDFTNDVLNVTYFIKGVKKQSAIQYDNIQLIRLAVKF